MKENRVLVMVAIAIVAYFILFQTDAIERVSTVAGNWDISEDVESQGYEQYLVETSDFDYTHPEVYAKAREIKSSTLTANDAVKDTMRFVVQNVRYSSAITIQECYEETASSVLATRIGDCVSMSRLVTALLRAQGIPARTMGGCAASHQRCIPLLAMVPGLDIQVTPMVEGDFKKRGFLHEWVEVWVPGKGWRILEATSGQLFPMECNAYIDYAYDTNNRERCVITDAQFWDLCKKSGGG